MDGFGSLNSSFGRRRRLLLFSPSDFQTALNTDGSWFRTQRAMLETTVAALEAELEGTKRNAEARERDQNDTITLLKEDLLGKTGALTDRISRIAELEDMEKKKGGPSHVVAVCVVTLRPYANTTLFYSRGAGSCHDVRICGSPFLVEEG